MTTRPVRLRFAPSPTGPLHLGGARTALYNWAAARAMGGKYLLRIEDTDRARSTDESLQIILEGLRWLGVDWDEGPEVGGDHGPYFQTERLDLYSRVADQLLESGHAYKCYATPDEVEEGRQRLQAEGKRPMYDRRHRDLTAAQCAAFEAEGRKASLRFRMPLDKVWALDDLTKGRVEVNLAELDDWVLVRPDGMPTYNFACVVDDHDMAISHVVRGEEHLMNGFKQSVLFDALGYEAPEFAHIPLILGKNGKKLSKRDAVTNILDYRDKGYLPDAIFNYIALLGWNFSGDQDVFTREEMVGKFRIDDINTGGSKFDDAKLEWMAGDYMRRLPVGDLVDQARAWLERELPAGALDAAHRPLLEHAVANYQERIFLLGQLPSKIAFVFTAGPVAFDADAEKKFNKNADAVEWLDDWADRLEASALPPSFPAVRGADGEWTVEQVEAACRAFVEERGLKFGQFVMPMRAAVSGTMQGAGIFDILWLVGRENSVARIRAAADRLRA